MNFLLCPFLNARVSEILTRETSIVFANIFKYDEDESFNNNSKFSVENEGFRIGFK